MTIARSSGKVMIPLFVLLGIMLVLILLVTTPQALRATGGANPQATSKTGAPLTIPEEFANDCQVCHGYNAAGGGPAHTHFIPGPANLTQVMNSRAMTESIIRRGIQGTAMPPNPEITSEDLGDILNFMANAEMNTQREWDWPYSYFAGAGMPPDVRTTPMSVAPDMGRTVYITECAGCHGMTGTGDPDDDRDPHVWPKPANFRGRNSTVGRDYFIISYGRPGTLMGAMAPTLQSEEARWAAALYVNSMLDPNSAYTITTGPMEFWKNPYSPSDQDVVNRGYTNGELYCGYCHGGQLAGTWLAPSLIDRNWIFGGGTDNAVYQIINDGVPGQLMPPHEALPTNVRWEVVTYMRAQGGLPAPIETEMQQREAQR